MCMEGVSGVGDRVFGLLVGVVVGDRVFGLGVGLVVGGDDDC